VIPGLFGYHRRALARGHQLGNGGLVELDADAGTVYLYDKMRQQLAAEASHGYPNNDVKFSLSPKEGVAGQGYALTPFLGDFGQRCFGALVVDIGDDYPAAFFGELEGDTPADALSAAGDNSYPIGQ
jgi:hypothetical protein